MPNGLNGAMGGGLLQGRKGVPGGMGMHNPLGGGGLGMGPPHMGGGNCDVPSSSSNGMVGMGGL